jgi:photosystem II stability/assembly factor-like uncharacterized protein
LNGSKASALFETQAAKIARRKFRMSWDHTLASRRRSLAMAAAVALTALGAMACHSEAPPPPPREGFAITDKFFDVKSIGNNSFVLVGYRSALARTEDGGAHWKRYDGPTRRSITRLGFLDAKVGWGVGQEGIIYKTEDGGLTWKEQQSNTKNALFDVAVTDPNDVWAIGDQSSILHTTDGGTTWTVQKLEISSIGVREDMTLAISDPIFYGVSCIDANTCTVVGEFGQIRTTSDGGKTWGAGHGGLLGGKAIYRDVMSMPTFLAVKARDAQHAVAVGTYGSIASTEDGVNWHWNDSPVPSPLYDIRILPDGNYLIVGASGIVLRGNPQDGWKTSELPAGVFTWISASDFDSAGHGVAGGGHGLVLTTSDFGKKWEWKANG